MHHLSELLDQTSVQDLGPLPAPRLALNATVSQALQMLVRARRGAVVVIDGAKPAGIFSERDVLRRMPEGWFTSREKRRSAPLCELMRDPPLVTRQTTLAEVMTLMVQSHCRHLVVVSRQGELRGMLTSTDLVQFLLDQFPDDTINLPPHLHQQYHRPEGA